MSAFIPGFSSPRPSRWYIFAGMEVSFFIIYSTGTPRSRIIQIIFEKAPKILLDGTEYLQESYRFQWYTGHPEKDDTDPHIIFPALPLCDCPLRQTQPPAHFLPISGSRSLKNFHYFLEQFHQKFFQAFHCTDLFVNITLCSLPFSKKSKSGAYPLLLTGLAVISQKWACP